jgi:hypothetical protein
MRILTFFPAHAAVLESVGTYKVLIIRHGKLDETIRVRLVKLLLQKNLIL